MPFDATPKNDEADNVKPMHYGSDKPMVVEERGRAQLNESWVRPDGTIERNVSMDLVIAAAKKVVSRIDN